MSSTELKALLWDIQTQINQLSRDAQVIANKLIEVEKEEKEKPKK